MMRIVLLILMIVSTGSAVSAQTSQGLASSLETTLIPGTTVWITDSQGREEKTRIVSVSGEAVTTASGGNIRHFRAADVRQVTTRRSDSVLNGALIGAGVGVASGLFLCRLTEPWANCTDDVGPMLRVGAIGAGVGIGIDLLIRGRKTIYAAEPGSAQLSAAPIVGRRAGGLQFSLNF